MNKQYFGLGEDKTVYGCLQSLFKLHPDFDNILNDIAENDPNSVLVFVNSPLATSIKARWTDSNLHALLEKSIFLKSMNNNDFLNLMNICDVLLDPIYFGSGNTFYESAYLGVPQISCPHDFMRSRIVYGGYAQISMSDTPIVSQLNLYAQSAINWANSPDRLQDFKVEITSKVEENLFRDYSVIEQYENLLL